MPIDNGYTFGTPREIEALKPQEKRYTAKDKLNNGLFIEVKPNGRKVWIYRYTFERKQERLNSPVCLINTALKRIKVNI